MTDVKTELNNKLELAIIKTDPGIYAYILIKDESECLINNITQNK